VLRTGQVFAIAMAVTSIPVISRIMFDLGILGTSFARVVLGVAVVEDIVLYVVLAIALGIATQGPGASFGLPAVLGFRSERHAEAAALLPGAEIAIEPTLVTELIPPGRDVLACGPEPMLQAVADMCPGAQLAWEAPMACGYGACYGCAVEIGGELKRLCVEGPVLLAA